MNLDMLAMISQIVGAAIFVVVAILIFRRWIQPAVVAYQAAKNLELAEAENRRQQMQNACADARAEIERADQDAGAIRDRGAHEVERERAHALDSAKAEAERIVRNAEDELGRARLAARDKLRIEFIEKALVKARSEAERRVDTVVDRRLVETTIDDVVRRPV